MITRTLRLTGLTLTLASAGCTVQVLSPGGEGGGATSTSRSSSSSSSSSSGSSSSGSSSSSASSSGSSSSGASSSSSSSSSSSGAVAKTATKPVAPTASTFMWQGVQDAFVDQDGAACAARVTIAAGDQALCFVGANGHLFCAGQIGDTVYGSTFADTGIGGVEQILMSPTFNEPNHDSICVIVSGSGGRCWGNDNDWGELGDGDMLAAPTPVPWGTATNLHRLATGTWDSICAITDAGDVSCAGYGFAPTPVPEGGGHHSVFIDTSGMVHVDGTTVLRVPNSRADCTITAAGYECSGKAYGTGGAVVDGTLQAMIPENGEACWLDSDGVVTCTPWSLGPPGPPFLVQRFKDLPVLAIAGNFYSDALCAVYSDGSISCMGKNNHGELGTGNTTYLGGETIVAPPGTIDVTCK